MLNELEVAIWQMINNEIELHTMENDVVIENLMMSALKAKELTADGTNLERFKVYETFLWHNYPHFMERYSRWRFENLAEIENNAKLALMF